MPKNRMEKNRIAVFLFLYGHRKKRGACPPPGYGFLLSPSIRQGRLAHDKVAQGIEAEFAKRSEANWSGKPDPAFGGDAPKNQNGKPDLKQNAAYSRVCQMPFSD
jgi:hypothetical protein